MKLNVVIWVTESFNILMHPSWNGQWKCMQFILGCDITTVVQFKNMKQPYGCFIFLNCTTVVMSQPKINCIHFHCPFHEGCIKILNDSVTQITTFSFMWTYFTNYVLYTWLIDNHIWILEYFLIVASLRLILSLNMYIFHVFVINCLMIQNA